MYLLVLLGLGNLYGFIGPIGQRWPHSPDDAMLVLVPPLCWRITNEYATSKKNS